MATMNISLPDDLEQHVRKRVAEGGYTSASEYVRRLIRNDEYESRSIIDPDKWHLLPEEVRIKQEKKLFDLLEKGMQGEATPVDEKFWEAIRARVKARREANGND